MKKINIIWLLLGAMFLITACSSDDEATEAVSPLRIIKSDIDFTAQGGTGTVVLAATSGVASAASSEPWCTVTVSSDTTVSVTVVPYEGIESRNSNVTITDHNNHAVHISATQTGMRFGLGGHVATLNDSGKGSSMAANISFMPTIDSPDWCTVTFSQDSLYFSAQPNTTGSVRSGYAYISGVNRKDSVLVVQGELKDILGSYRLAGQDGETGEAVYLDAELKGTAGNLRIEFPKLGWKCPVQFNASTLSFTLAGGTNFGTYEVNDSVTYNVGACLWDTEQGYITWAKNYTYNCQFQSMEGYTVGVFEDNGSWPNYTVSGLYLALFDSDVFSSESRQSTLLRLAYPVLIKEQAAGAKPMRQMQPFVFSRK